MGIIAFVIQVNCLAYILYIFKIRAMTRVFCVHVKHNHCHLTSRKVWRSNCGLGSWSLCVLHLKLDMIFKMCVVFLWHSKHVVRVNRNSVCLHIESPCHVSSSVRPIPACTGDHCMLGYAPAPSNPAKDNKQGWMMDGWMYSSIYLEGVLSI